MVKGLSSTIRRRLRDQMAKASGSTARERYIAKTGKKGQKGPLARILPKSKTGKPSPHVDPPKRKRMTADDLKKLMGRKGVNKYQRVRGSATRDKLKKIGKLLSK